MMKTIRFRFAAVLVAGLLLPASAWADFSFDEIPTFVEDQSPDWLFQLLSSIFLGIFQVFFAGLFGTTG